jgi:hypothetical protein
MLTLLLATRVMNLAELTCSIEADDNLRRRVTEAGSREHGCSCSGVEEAIVLLGRQRIYALLAENMFPEGGME